jgi:hypothetical protein
MMMPLAVASRNAEAAREAGGKAEGRRAKRVSVWEWGRKRIGRGEV